MIFLVKRLVRSLVVMFGVTTLVFIILRLAPGDPALIILGQNASEEAVAQLRHSIGLDQSIFVQVMRFTLSVARGDLGISLIYQRPALSLVLDAFPATLLLGGAAFLLTIVVAIPAGIGSAIGRGTRTDALLRAAILITQALPTFWIGIMLIYVFAVWLRWLPTSGSGSWAHLILPAITLSTYQWALLTRIVRSGMLEVLQEDYIRTARAKGLHPRHVVLRHAFPNTLIPIVTVIALQLGVMLSGAVITEAVFAWPGIGTLAMGAILARDYPLIQAVVLFSAALVISLNLFADALYTVLDPRTRR
jgi:peptide/nickel transport system permease protein